MNPFFEGLKISIPFGETINFLDLIISKNNLTNSLDFSLYVKKTNTFNYLLNTSNHPNFIFKNLPKSLFIRIRRICTHYYDYIFFENKITWQLVKRGYKLNSINKISRQIRNIDRSNLLPYKDNIKFIDKLDVVLCCFTNTV